MPQCRNRAFCYTFCSYVLVYKVPCSKTNLNLGITSRLSWLDQMQRYLDDVFHCQLYCKKIEISMNTHWKSYIIEMLMIYDYYSPHLWKFIEFKIFHYFFYQCMYNVYACVQMPDMYLLLHPFQLWQALFVCGVFCDSVVYSATIFRALSLDLFWQKLDLNTLWVRLKLKQALFTEEQQL